MTIDQAATFFVGSILVGMGSIVIASVILFINYLYTKYWTPVKWLNFIEVPMPPQEPEKLVEPQLDKRVKK